MIPINVPIKKTKDVQISVRVDKDTVEQLRMRHVNIAEIVRQALESALSAALKSPPQSK
jgi:post-segregation antitoxin (ccd killing protein)